MPSDPRRPLPVTESVEEARREVAAGRRVVLIVPPEGGGVVPAPAGVHVFVGDPLDPATQRAAAEMAAELGAVG